MTILGITLTVSDLINLFGILASLLVSIIAIGISILSLRQTSKMIEDSTRPNIQIYPVFLNNLLYIVIRNFGNSEAIIDEITCSHHFSAKEYLGNPNDNGFLRLKGSSFCPGYSLRCPLIAHKVANETYEFKLKYHSSTHKYEASFAFNPYNATPFADPYPSGNSVDENIQNISKSLRDMVKLQL